MSLAQVFVFTFLKNGFDGNQSKLVISMNREITEFK